MTRWNRYLIVCGVAMILCSCNEDSNSKGETPDDDTPTPEACLQPSVLCGETCVDLTAKHWHACGVCVEGYEDADGDDANGCESPVAQPEPAACEGDAVRCGETCVDLAEKNWSACGVCAEGYENADGDESNGCETVKPVLQECESGEIQCGDACVSLAEKHWSACGVCLSGYEDADGDDANGCEQVPVDERCGEGKVLCEETCVDLTAMHWSSCGVCLSGYEDADSDATNGCESPICAEGLVNCSGTCTNLATRHWTSCGVCAEGYADADGELSNGCEQNTLAEGQCHDSKECANLYHVQQAICDTATHECIIQSCAAGYADCDGDPTTGCEVDGSKDYYHCGAKGLCTGDAGDDANYRGAACKLGDQCKEGRCTAVPEIVGCSDGTREGFLDLIRFNNLAACGGAWTIPGIHHNEGPACGRQSGNTGTNRNGEGCNLEDLCAEGWHVCLGRGDVQSRSDYGCDGILEGAALNEPAIFITRTSSTGSLECDPDTVGVPINMNDIFGCGNFGSDASGAKCPPLTVSGHNNCDYLKPNFNYTGTYGHGLNWFTNKTGKTYTQAWFCESDGWHEATNVTKTQPDTQGGVMCCKNQCNEDVDCGKGLICRYGVCVECIINEKHETEGCAAGKTCNQQHQCV